MVDLNLCVDALKPCANIKRSSDMRGAMIPIPTTDSKRYSLKPFLEATNSIKQIEAAKKIFNNANTLNFLAEVLFNCPLKNSLRETLTNLFSNNCTAKKDKAPPHKHSKETLQRALSNALYKKSVEISDPNISVDYINDVFVSVGGCLNNFPNGRDALAKVIYSFIPLLPKTSIRIWMCISDTEGKLSPTRRNELYLFLQNIWRFHVAYLLQFHWLLEPEKCQDFRLISETAEDVAFHVMTPWDVRSIAGLVIGQTARFFNEFDYYLKKCKDLTAYEYLPIKAASLLVLQRSDYTLHTEITLQILTGILDTVKQAGNFPSLVEFVSKLLFTYSKSLSDIHLMGRPLIMFNIILTNLLRFSLNNLSNPVESIRHINSKLMHHALLIAKHGGQQNIVNHMYTIFNRREMPLSAACLLVLNLAKVDGTDSVIIGCSGLFQSIFSEFLGVEDYVYTLYKSLMTAAHKEIPYDRWIQQWFMPLMSHAKDPNRIATIESLVKLAVQLDHKVLGMMMKQTQLPFSSKLGALVTARRSGQHKLVKSIILDYTGPLSKAIVGADDKTRLQALSFVVETPKLSESYAQFEMDAVIKYIENNANNPNGKLRQMAAGILQKAIKRLELNLAQQLKETNPLPDDHMLMQFVTKLINIFMLNLFPSANYGRRWLSMHIMKDIIGMMERLNLNWISKLPAQSEQFLHNCLKNSYEKNKILAATLLKKLVVSDNQLLPEEMLIMLTSLRPAESLTAAYQLQVYCQAQSVQKEVPQPEKLTNYQPRYFAVFNWLIDHLKCGLETAKKDLTLAAKTNPLYGLLFASRHLLHQLNWKKLSEEQLWRELIQQLVSLCMIVSELMLPVVGKSPDVDQNEGQNKVEAEVEAKAQAETEIAEAEAVAEVEATIAQVAADIAEKVSDSETESYVVATEAIVEAVAHQKALNLTENSVEKTAEKSTDEKNLTKNTVEKSAEKSTDEWNLTEKTVGKAAEKLSDERNSTEKLVEKVAEKSTDEKNLTEKTPEKSADENSTEKSADKKNVLSIVPEFVVLCAWRSVKEVSLILGELVEQAPLQQEDTENYLLSKQQVSDIGEHFLILLAEIKHGAAFEQVYVGFSKLCRRFWLSKASELNAMPILWLNESMQMICGKDSNFTHCSAGVPHILQALICTALKLGTNKNFTQSMSLLLHVCESRQPGPTAAIARSHALNTLRTLFSCKELSNLVEEYIERGVQCGLESIDAEECTERNSAILLLSALMIRIFGVKRNDVCELNVHNRITARIFFKRYPKLFDYFHDGLRQAAIAKIRGNSTSGQTVKMEAMLQFLSRLYPSSLEDFEDTSNLSNFVAYLQIICGVHDELTRQRASQVLANFISPKLAESSFCKILNKFRAQIFFSKHVFKTNQLTKDFNGLHGNLLQLLNLYGIIRGSCLKLINRALRLLTILAVQTYMHNMELFNAVINVLIAILKDTDNAQDITGNQLSNLEFIAQLDQKLVHDKCKKYGISPKFHYVFALHLNRLTLDPTVMTEHILSMLIRPKLMPQEMQQFTVDLLLCLLFGQSVNISQTRGLVENFEIKHFDFDPEAVIYFKSLSPSVRQRLASFLGRSDEAIKYVLKMANKMAKHPKSHPDLGSKVHTLLALMNQLDLTIPQLLKRRNCNLEPGLIICLMRQVQKIEMRNRNQQEIWMPLLTYALDISRPTRTPYVRFKAAQLVDRLTVYKQPMLATGNVEIISTYMRVVLQLLADDSELVRNYTAEMISSCMEYNFNTRMIKLQIPDSTMLPMQAENFFLKHILAKLHQNADNGTFLVTLFTKIAEPIVSSSDEKSEISNEEADEEVDVEVQVVFDKEEPNVYCERLRVVSNIIQEFRNAFPNNKLLISFLVALEKMFQLSSLPKN